MPFFIIGIISVVLIIILLVRHSRSDDAPSKPQGPPGGETPQNWEWNCLPEYEIAGMQGEKAATRLIAFVLCDDDCLLTNVQIEYDGKPAELDNVIVNKYGVFIIEVKNYKGYLVGGEEDYEWQKYKTTDAGNTYEKTVRNPIKQVKRQVFLLARYLDYYGLRVWVRGYVILLQANSPVDSEYLLNSMADIDRAVHTRDRTMLSANTVKQIKKLLE